MMVADILAEEMSEAQDDLVNGLAASPEFVRDGVCFAAQNSALYRSDDGGATWRSCYDSLVLDAPLATTTVALSPAFASDGAVFAGAPGGVLRSRDGGASWQITLLPDPPPLVTALAVSPRFVEDGIVLAATLEDGVFQSSDRGNAWAAWNFGLLDLNVLCLAISPDFARDETLFAGTGSGLFRSSNGGRAWREVELPVECPPVLSIALTKDAVLVGTETEGLFTSQDGGRSWQRLGTQELDGAINAILTGESSNDLLVVQDDTLWVSRDAGASWSPWQHAGEGIEGVAAVAAPHGIAEGAPLLIGMFDGSVVRL